MDYGNNSALSRAFLNFARKINRDTRLTQEERRVITTISVHVDNHRGEAILPDTAVAKETLLPPEKIAKATDSLVEKGLLTKRAKYDADRQRSVSLYCIPGLRYFADGPTA